MSFMLSELILPSERRTPIICKRFLDGQNPCSIDEGLPRGRRYISLSRPSCVRIRISMFFIVPLNSPI